jgi:hypothetical protein
MAKKKRTSRIRKANTSKWGRPAEGSVKTRSPHRNLVIPSGKCPAELKGDDRESIREWVVKITELKPENVSYHADVYKYWVRDFYESYSEECKNIRKIIDTIVTDRVNKISDIGA